MRADRLLRNEADQGPKRVIDGVGIREEGPHVGIEQDRAVFEPEVADAHGTVAMLDADSMALAVALVVLTALCLATGKVYSGRKSSESGSGCFFIVSSFPCCRFAAADQADGSTRRSS